MLVVWVPVIATDLGPPAARTLALVSDPRVVQFWDPKLALSREILRSMREGPDVPAEAEDEDAIVWDWVGLYAAGVRWEPAKIPGPELSRSPVVMAKKELRAAFTSRPASP